jgi:histidyl-tRNA synthetase
MGWAAGVERILLAGEAPEVGQPGSAPPLELFVAREDPGTETARRAFALLGEARSAGLTAQMDLGGRSLKGQLGAANDLGARYVAIVAGAAAALKDMQGGGQREMEADAVVHAVLRGQHDL